MSVARRRVAAAVVALVGASSVAACAADGGEGRPDPLDIVRDQVAADEGGPSVATTGPTVDAASTVTTIGPAIDELPPPDASAFVGRNRVVNLWVGAGGVTQTIDVWARRSFTNGPVLLASGLAFGSASDYVAAPVNQSVVIVGAGAGPDGLELASVFNAGDGEQITAIFTNDDDAGTVWAPNLFEVDPDGASSAPLPPSDGNGLVFLDAPNTGSFESSLTLAIGAAAFYVGDGTGSCATQRIEADGFAASILGGTQSVQLDLPPGRARPDVARVAVGRRVRAAVAARRRRRGRPRFGGARARVLARRHVDRDAAAADAAGVSGAPDQRTCSGRRSTPRIVMRSRQCGSAANSIVSKRRMSRVIAMPASSFANEAPRQ